MSIHLRNFSAFLFLSAALLATGGSPRSGSRENQRTMPFPVAELFFELNDTDGDLGIHADIDGGPWTSMLIEGPDDRQLLNIVSSGRLRAQGMTQLAFESAEPSFDELDPADFFRRFPEGKYEIEARTQDGGTLESTVRLSHVLAARPGNITVAGLPAAQSCEAETLPEVVVGPILIRWDPVTGSHPDIGKTGHVQISRYQFFLELPGGKLSIDLPPTTTEYEFPLSTADSGQVLKFEIIARTTTGNNTAVESCFKVK